MTRRAALLVLLALVAGCGGHSRLQRDREAVDRYVGELQSVMQRDAAGLKRANDAYVAYARGGLPQSAVPGRMRQAQRTVEDVRDGVLVLAAPAPARRLRERLVAYLDLNADLARETALLAAYVPAAQRALRPVPEANRRLARRLRTRDSDAQARALGRFGAALARVTHALRALHPPAVLAPADAARIAHLEATRRVARQLQRALVARDAQKVAVLLRSFRRAARGSGAASVLERQARARYARRLAELSEAYRAVRRETVRLQRTLS